MRGKKGKVRAKECQVNVFYGKVRGGYEREGKCVRDVNRVERVRGREGKDHWRKGVRGKRIGSLDDGSEGKRGEGHWVSEGKGM